MKSTGIHDKHRREVFVGDIVTCWDNKNRAWHYGGYNIGRIVELNKDEFSLQVGDIIFDKWMEADNIEKII